MASVAAAEMASQRVIICCVVVTYCVGLAAGGVHFSSLADTLLVNATIDSNSSSPNVARAGTDQLVVTWRLNESVPAGTDASYKRVKVKLCFAPISQVDRLWRKTNDDLKKDKTCQFDIADQPYSSGNRASRVTWTVGRNVAGASYFVRAYALNARGSEVGYGQTTDRNKSSNLFVVDPISGRHASLDIATACFSLFSVLVLLGFFVAEKMAVKRAQKN